MYYDNALKILKSGYDRGEKVGMSKDLKSEIKSLSNEIKNEREELLVKK